MKRTERHHLKENELDRLARQARETVGIWKREATVAIAAVVIVGAVVLGYVAWKDRVNSRAEAMLAEALAVADTRVGAPVAPGTPGAGPSFPSERVRAEAALAKFKTAADAYPDSDAGIFARYRQAATEMEIGNTKQAAVTYQQVIDRAGDRIYGQMARLGVAEAQARSGQYDQAINTFKELAQHKDGPLPVDGILMQLGLAYRDSGKKADAQQTFNRLVEEYPDSTFSMDAKKELDNLKKTT
jgi:predicted negative regulator of RcsB-dependent stress response